MKVYLLRFIRLFTVLILLLVVALWIVGYRWQVIVESPSTQNGPQFQLISARGDVEVCLVHQTPQGRYGRVRFSRIDDRFKKMLDDERRRSTHFGFSWFSGTMHDLTHVPEAYVQSQAVRTPCWFLAILAAVVPAWWLRGVIRRGLRLRYGLCPACGYDLRATPDRCPECGHPADKTSGTGIA